MLLLPAVVFLIVSLSLVLSNHMIGDDAILIVNCTTEEIQVSWRGINNCLNSDYHCRLSLNYTFGSEDTVVWNNGDRESFDRNSLTEDVPWKFNWSSNATECTVSGYYIHDYTVAYYDYDDYDHDSSSDGLAIREVSVMRHSGYCFVKTGEVGDSITFKLNCTEGANTLWWERKEHCRVGDCRLFLEVSCNYSTEALSVDGELTDDNLPWTIEWPENVTECKFAGSYINGTSTNTAQVAAQQFSIPPFPITKTEDCMPTDTPIFLASPENLTVVAPEDATFFCEATARPGPAITWWRVEEGVNVQLLNGTNYTIVDEATGEGIRNSTLTVIGTEPSDALEYFCRASNMAGMVEATAELTVHVAPVILIPPENLTVISPNNATFFCQATARPGPDITWWRVEDDGNISRVMETTEEYAIVNVEMGERVRNSTLVVIDSQPSDTGVYRCLANNVSYDSATANLIVYAPNPSPSPSSSPSSSPVGPNPSTSPLPSPAIIVAPVCTVGLAILVLVFAVAFIRHKKKRSNPFKYFGKPYADPVDKNYDPVRISRDPTVESLKTLLEPYNSNESQLEHNDSGTNSLYEQKHAKSDEHQISNNTLVPTIVTSAPECAQPTLHIERDGYIHQGIPTPLAYDEQATMMEDDTDIADVSHALATVTEFNCVPGVYGQPVSQSDGKGYVTLKDQVNSPIVEDQGFTLETGYEKLSLVESSSAGSGLISSLATSVAPSLPPVSLTKEPTSLPAAAIDTSSVVAATAPPHTSTSPFQSGDSRPSAVVLQVSEAPFLHPTTTAATTTTTSSSSRKEPTAPGPTPSPTSGTTSEGGVAHSHGPAPPLLQAGSEDSTLQSAEPPGVEDLDMGGMENDVEPIGASSEQHPGSMTGYLSFDGGRAGNSSANPFEMPLQPTNEAMRYSSGLFPVTNSRLPTEVLPTASFTQPDITCPLVLAA